MHCVLTREGGKKFDLKKGFQIASCLIGILALSACGSEGIGDASGELSGEELARIHCSRCHAFTEPEFLDKRTWREGVLPQMALRLGVQDSIEVRQTMERAFEMRRMGVHPLEPLVDTVEWKRIVDYIVQAAPDTLIARPEAVKPAQVRDAFAGSTVDLGVNGRPLTTLVHWEDKEGSLYVGEGSNHLFRLNGQGNVQDKFAFSSPPVALEKLENGGMYVLSIGHVHPNDEPKGALSYLSPDGRIMSVLQELPRPVAMARGDLDADGEPDLVICGFGHHVGRLSWWKGLGNQRFEEHTLLDQPGALSTWIRDLDADGLPDILTLMAQGDERVVMHRNLGEGKFRAEILLRFNPVMGSSYLEPADMDGDGDLDLIYTNGDNADYSFSRKPYHGVRIFENDGNLGFRETYFYPLPGATKAVPYDFDKDGSTDLAAISFFPYFEDPDAIPFVLLKQQAGEEGLDFTPVLLPGMQDGRWLTLEAADLDRDGWEDLALGSFSYSPTPTPEELVRSWARSPVDVLLLRRRVGE